MTELGALLAKRIKEPLPRVELEAYLETFLKEQTMCTLATSSGDYPRATPLEYYSEGLTLYLFADRGVKTRNLEANPNLSIAVCNTFNPNWENEEWKGLRSAQITAHSELLTADSPEWEHALNVYKWQPFMRLLGREVGHVSRERLVLKVTPSKIELMDFGLIRRGYGGRQVWEAAA